MHTKNYIKKALICLLAVITVLSSTAVVAFAASVPTNKTVQTIFDFLVDEMGLNSAAACGVLANIEKESNFNPNLYGDNGSSLIPFQC